MGRLRLIPVLVISVAVLGLPPFLHSAYGDGPFELISGEVEVFDGETLLIGELIVRIWGIEAPALDQTCLSRDDARVWRCGEEAARALEAFIDGREIICGHHHLQLDEDIVADCTRGEADVGAWLVRNGWALDRPSQSDGHYARDQDIARSERAGLWGGRFELPWIWRKKQDL